MINIDELKELMELIDQSSIKEFKIKDENIHIHVKKAEISEASASLQLIPSTAILETACDLAAVSNIATEAAEVSNLVTSVELVEIHSNWVGVFASTVKIGDQIKKGQIVCRCHVDRLKLSHDITSQEDGEIVDILVEDGQLIDFGQPLFVVGVDPRRTDHV